MAKKFLAIFAAIAMLFALTPSAQAAGSLTQTNKVSFEGYADDIKLVQVTPKLKVALWTKSIDSSFLYESAIVSADGVLGMPTQIGQSGTQSMNSRFEYTVSSTGLLAVVYNYVTDLGNGNYGSVLRVVYSYDGTNWSAPVQPLPQVTFSFCDFFEATCGYQVQKVVFDHLDHLVLLASYGDIFVPVNLYATTSNDGVVWSSPTTLQTDESTQEWSTNFGHNSCVQLVATASTTMASWCVSNGADNTLEFWSARIPDPAHPFWLAPVRDYSSAPGTYFYGQKMFATSKGDIVETLWEPAGGHQVLGYMTWSKSTATWSGPIAVYTSAKDYVTYYGFSEPNGNLIAQDWVEFSGGIDDVIKTVVYKDGVPGVVSTMRAVAGDGSSNDGISSASVAADSTVSLTFWNSSLRKAFLLEQIPGGATTTTELPTDLSYNYGTRISQDSLGNLTILGYWVPDTGSGYDLVVYQKNRATKPAATAGLKISGMAKVKGKLSSTTVSFSSISGASAAASQWYSCTKQVKKSPLVLPKTCKAIKGASKAKYVVTKADVKKFILVSLSSTNGVGKTTVFSPSTAAVK